MNFRPQRQPFRIIIIGGSIAGLTLAHALSKLNIEFVVLEQRGNDSSRSNGGAALTLLPNGLRILDQLGLLKHIQEAAEPIHTHTTWLEDGRLLRSIDMTALPLIRNGYSPSVIERQALLDILLRDLDPSRIHWNKKVTAFQHFSSYISVECSDGSTYVGNLVVGADGIHSIAQREVLRKAGSPSVMPRLKVEFSGIFGISNPVPGLFSGQVHRTYGGGFSFIVTVGKHGLVYWVLSVKNGTSLYDAFPRYRQDQALIDQKIEPFLDTHITSDILFAEIYQKAVSCYHVPLEERLGETWGDGRIVCVGDSVHKMTPNLAQGANSAVESAASLANGIALINEQSNVHLARQLQAWGTARKRQMRLFHCSSWILARCEAFTTLWFKALGLYIGYCHGEQVISYISDIGGQTHKLEFMPVPKRKLAFLLRRGVLDGGRFSYANYYFAMLLFSALRVVLWIHGILSIF